MKRKIFAVLLTGAMLTAGLSTTVFADGEKPFVYGTTGYSEEMGDAGLNPHDNYSDGAHSAMVWERLFLNTTIIWKWSHGLQQIMSLWMILR